MIPRTTMSVKFGEAIPWLAVVAVKKRTIALTMDSAN